MNGSDAESVACNVVQMQLFVATLTLLLLAAGGCISSLFLVYEELGEALFLVPLETGEVWLL